MNSCVIAVSEQIPGSQETTGCHGICEGAELGQMNASMNHVKSYVNMMSSRIRSQDAANAVTEDWEAVAKIVDRLLFYVAILLIILSAVWVALLGLTTSDNR